MLAKPPLSEALSLKDSALDRPLLSALVEARGHIHAGVYVQKHATIVLTWQHELRHIPLVKSQHALLNFFFFFCSELL